ncbi:MAG: ferric reductase-like transmembrane domain-containing protein [Hyphomonadaceae bacterium]|nr:ferric reductase-like transmembrane domain-containing protein [Hyphomonadaceae bacterium]
MAHGYRAVQWNAFKRMYDLALVAGAATYVIVFTLATLSVAPPGESYSEIQVLIRAFGGAAFGLLHLILMIGPLARLTPRAKPLLYNRRHMGVLCFALALIHASLVLLWYHGFSDLNPLVSLLVSNPRYASIGGFPFESLGLLALAILFLMAATSHDFWNANLGPVVWKSLHMAVYAAYALLVAHVMLGVVQYERSLIYPMLVSAGATALVGLHLTVGWREWAKDRAAFEMDREGWLRIAPVSELIDGRAKIIAPPHGERIAIFRNGDRVLALSNVCRHQGGPLGEGRIIDGCVVCPWHGFQYLPETGRSPPPFVERVDTFRTRIVDGIVYVHPAPCPADAPAAPSLIRESAHVG